MTSTCTGLEGPSFGFVCYDFISAGKSNLHFNNYGGEDRMWLSPEGGQYSLWFKPGETQNLANWHTAPMLNTRLGRHLRRRFVARPLGSGGIAAKRLGREVSRARYARRAALARGRCRPAIW